MRDLLRRIWQRLRLGSETTSLGWSLAAINVVIAALLVGGIAFSAVGMLRDLADEQGKARALLAGAIAREDLRRVGEDALATARVLADRPVLQRLLSSGSASGGNALAQFLRRFCETGGMDACAVFRGDQLVAQGGVAIPWNEIEIASAEQGESFLAAPATVAYPLLGAVTQLGESTDLRVYIIRLLDDELAHALSRRVGLQVRLINYRGFNTGAVDAFTSVHSAGLADGRSAVQRIQSLDLYASSFPVFAATGEAIALIETRLPAEELDTLTGRLVQQLWITALVIALLAVLAGILLGQFVAGPVRALTRAAVRLGEGDFSTSIPPRGPAEVGALARTMEDMRRNLVDLTGTLRRHEAEAQSVLSGIVEGVYAVDKNRVIRYLNPQAARLLGVKPEDAVGKFCGDVLKPCSDHGRLPCDFNCPILQARVAGRSQAMERLQARGGEARSTVIASSGMAEGLQVQVIRDETELEAVRRARDSVLANISHEFRTPLAAQLASIELLQENLQDMPREQIEELVTSLRRGSLRLTRLIDNLLESVRIESGQLSIRQQDLHLAEVVQDAVELVGSLLVQRGQALHVEVPDDLPPIVGDGPRLVQVFVNLLANANKFGPDGSSVRIAARVEGNEIVATVDDEGTGVQEPERGSIFERFYRSSDQEPEPRGLGLGLWIVKSIVERHGGRVGATRTEDGRSRLVVALPVAAGRVPA
jgi:signal transduction histidine kinase